MAVCTLTACSDDDGGGQPVITGVRLTDPAKVDSTFTQAERGTMLLIMGEHIGGVKEVYINNQVCSFNSTYNTSSYLILTIPYDLNIVNVEQHEIRLVTDHGTAVYAFRVVGAAPALYDYRAQWQMDAEGNRHILPGTVVTLLGANFYDVEDIYITTDSLGTGQRCSLSNFTVGEEQDQITVIMPPSFPEKGYLFVQCYQGTTSPIVFSASPTLPTISSISSDMPVEGEQVTIFGRNFIDITGIRIGDVVIGADKLSVNADENEITFIMPEAPAATDGKLTLLSANGNVEYGFYDYSMVITDFDNHSSGWFSWGGQHVTEEDGQFVPQNHSGHIHGLEGKPGAYNWWWGQLYFGGFQLPSAIPANTPMDDIELRFEYYIGAPVDDGAQWRMYLSNDESHVYENFYPTDYLTKGNRVGHWMTFSSRLSRFTDAATYGDYKFSGDFAMQVLNPSDNGDAEVIFYIDNIRLFIKNTEEK